MLWFLVAVAVLNLGIGFGSAVYLAARLGVETPAALACRQSAATPQGPQASPPARAGEVHASLDDFAETLGIPAPAEPADAPAGTLTAKQSGQPPDEDDSVAHDLEAAVSLSLGSLPTEIAALG